MSGNKAVANGLKFEAKVYAALKLLNGVSVKRNIPYPSIYSTFGRPAFTHSTKMEFRAEDITLIYKTLDYRGQEINKKRTFNSLNIECKYQEHAGSIDEKYPFVHQNALISDAEATLFVYQAPNHNIKKGALSYMEHVALHSNERLIMLEYSDFIQSLAQSYNINIEDEKFTVCPLSKVLKEGSIANDFDSFLLNKISGYENLRKDANKRFKLALSIPSFKNSYESYLDLKHKLVLGNLGLGLKHCHDGRDLIDEVINTRYRLEKELEECGREFKF
jgi:hypothetical protein